MVLNDFWNPADRSCYSGLAQLHDFNQRQRQALPQRRDRKDIQRSEKISRVSSETDQMKMFSQAQCVYQLLELFPLRAIAGNRKLDIRRFCDDARRRLDQKFKTL